MWIARDFNGDLFLYKNKPYKLEYEGTFTTGEDCKDFEFLEEGIYKFPFKVTWENSPIEVNIDITKKE